VDKKYLYDILDNLLEGVWIEAPDGLIVYVNSRLLSLCGYDTPDELLGHRRDVLTTLEDPRMVEPNNSRDSRFTCETLLRNRNGTSFAALLGMTPLVTSTGYEGRLYSIIDLRERKRLENEVRRSESRFRDLIEVAPDGICIVEENSMRVFNRRLEEMTRYSKDELRRTPFSRLIAGRDHGVLTDIIDPQNKYLLPGQHEVRLLAAGGKEIDIELRMVPVEYEGRSALLCFLRDISPVKELNKMKTEFVAMISHELRTPLAMIKEAVALLSEGPGLKLEGAPLRFLTIAQDEINRLNRMVDNLLEISRMEAVAMRLRIAPVRVSEIVDRVIVGLQVRLREKAITIDRQVPAGVNTIHADEDRLYQVISNILDNAVKFSPANSAIRISVENLEPGAPLLEAKNLPLGERYVMVTVADSGPGIPADYQERIFRKFERVNQGAMPGPKGIGLGLAIAKSIVEMHGGRIWVKSELGKGSEFSAILPCRPVEDR
jgi:PAS domain S-box-containing protein